MCSDRNRDFHVYAAWHSLILASSLFSLHIPGTYFIATTFLCTMALARVRRHLSTLASGPNNRKARTTTLRRSTSGSTISSKCSTNQLPTDENLTGRSRKRRHSFTFDRLLTNNEIREGVALALKENSPSVSTVFSEAAHGNIGGHQDRASDHAGDKFPPVPDDHLSSYPAAGEAPVDPLPSGTSSRRTTIFVGKPKHPASLESQGQDGNGSGLKVEQNYYDSVNPTGTSRRRSMLRSISKDDYLLARGANPRTGIITPGVHSASSSYEEVELLKQRGIVPPSKWRQRGDQWVSLDVGEPTPLPSPPKGQSTPYAGRPLQAVPRLTAGKYNHDIDSRTTYQKTSVSTPFPDGLSAPDGVPGKFPTSPQREYQGSSATTRPSQGPTIKRKPVASPPRNNDGRIPPKQITPQKSTDTVIKRPFATQLRSSSAPAPHTFKFETPNDVGKDFTKALPSVPNRENCPTIGTGQQLEFQQPFLGRQWPKGVENVRGSKMSAPFKPEKELPCLPMSNGQYPLRASEQEVAMMSRDMATANSETRRIMGSRGGDPSYPYVRNTKMNVLPPPDQITRNTSIGTGIRTPIMSTPIYDNPPIQILARPVRSVIGGPRSMNQPMGVGKNIKKASDIFKHSPVTTSTNTRIPTHISTLQPKLQGRSHRMALGFEASYEQRFYQRSQDRIYPNDLRQWNRSMSSNVLTAMPWSRPRAQSRPQMPDRADAHMHSVPRMITRRSNQVDFTENHRQWRTTGTGEGALGESKISAASTTSSEIDRKLEPKPMRPTLVNQNATHPASFRNGEERKEFLTDTRISSNERREDSPQSSGLMRKCSHCQIGFAAGSPPSIAGHTPVLVPETVATETKDDTNAESQQRPVKEGIAKTEITSAHNSASTEEQVDERDHTACCTECCTVEDCHEGCLGHPSSSVHSFGGSTFVGSTSTPIGREHSSRSVSVPSRAISSPLKDKLSFVQGLRMRKTLRTRHCPDDGKTIKERCNILDLPPIEFESHLSSSGSFWGSDEGALAAAKKALGVRKRAANTPSVIAETTTGGTDTDDAKRAINPPRLVIPKVRGLRSRNASKPGNVAASSRVSRSCNASAASNLSAITSASRSRNVSGTSILTIEIPHIFSSLGTINVAGVLEMLRVPFEAAAMWIQTHPDAQKLLWRGVETALGMAKTVVETAGTVWEVSYVYSKTGRLRCKTPGGICRLVLDCGRSIGYLLVFVALAACVGRVFGFVLGLGQGLLLIARAVGWLLKKLGSGLLW